MIKKVVTCTLEESLNFLLIYIKKWERLQFSFNQNIHLIVFHRFAARSLFNAEVVFFEVFLILEKYFLI